MAEVVRLDKKISPFLVRAIDAARNSELAIARQYNIEEMYILFEDTIHNRNGRACYTIHFYAEEVTASDWMSKSVREVGGINIDIDINTKEVIYIYGDR